ncbi:MAG TPA: (Fe-S)-binding protein, partial [Leptospiraceae bacterium]|nr:(Fe-S)-binding protein [Leptospiraceae bacterium]
MNFFMIRGTPRGQMTHMDMENAAVYGAGNVRELPWTSMLDGLSCIECGRCTVQCPANRTGKPLDPKKIMVDIKHSMIENTNTLLKTEDPAAALIGDPFITEEELWGCTSCYACVEACPVGNNQLEAILEMRRNLVLAESRFPSHLQLAFQNMENNSNPWGVGAHTRADWCADLNVKTMAEDSNVDVLYWVGCAGSFDDRNKTIARSFVKIMQGAGVKFSILGTEENCTGDSARRGGNEYLFQTLAQTNIETMNRYNVKKVVTACPHCYNTLKNEYPQMGGNYEVQHHTDFIDDLIRDGKVEMDPATVEDMKSRRGTYHDSCYLGRYNDVYDQPRNIVEQTLGRGIPEASDHHSTSLCCGAGGAQMWMEEQYDRVNVKRTNQLLETGADT